jgi:hypothetical protein
MKEQYIREELQAVNGNISKLARSLGMDYQTLKDRYAPTLGPIVRPTEPMPEDISTLGRSGWERYVIAVKENGEQWPAKFSAAIHDARRKFDNGTHIMCQEKRSDGWVVQYLIPRKIKLQYPVPFFSRNWGF